MSPASQGNLEVERYIGSCLISARVNNNSSKNNVSNNHHGNYKNKKVANGEGGTIPRGGRLQSRPLLGGCPHHGYPMVPACECARYGSPGRAAPGGWAGMPLISMAVNARRNRKPPPPPPLSATLGPPRNMKPSAAPGSPGPGDGDAFLRTPLSRLAIHTQGAPLILAGNYGGRKNNTVHRGPGRQVKVDLPGRKFNGDVSGARNTGNNNTPSSDCLSVASDESSGHSENSLPRIIKPRKRRKKDRKPPASPASETNSTESDPVTESSTIVTLKPYVPLCHDLYDGHRGVTHRREDVESRRKTWEKQRLTPEDDRRISQSSEEDVQNLKLDDAEDGDALLNTLFPYRCPPSICQCRYCDPSGLIWDVDQHCYSPFLTPPSLDLSYSTSPFVNIPLFLPPPPEVRSLDLFNKDFEDSSSPLVDTDHKEPVRRSWSEPSASFSVRDDARASSSASSVDFGVIGGGRTCDDVSRNGRKDTRHSSTSSDSSLPQSLEVSTEIVTSLNGHRDIEIKFYSSSPPSVVADAIFYRSGCESDDNNVSQHDLWSSCTEHRPVCLEDMNHARFSSVWGNSCEPEDPNHVSDTTWSSAWEVPREQVTDSSNESNSKLLSDEVNQLCLHNVEE